MIKKGLRFIANRFGFDFIKTEKYRIGTRFRKKSSDPFLDYFETPNGNYYLPKNNNGDIVANAMKEGRLFDEEIVNLAKRYIKPNTCIIDIGANFGQMAIEFSKIDRSCKVYAFEAQKMVFDILQKNIQSNNAENISAFYNAVYNQHNKDFLFPVPDLKRFPSYGSYGIDLNAEEGIAVKSITIDSIDFDMPISFMKIDIQGSDLAAMQGAVNTIKKHKMPIVFEYEEQFQDEFNTTFQDYVEFVAGIGYKFVKTIQGINFLIVPKEYTGSPH